MAAFLQGVRVLDLTKVLAGPFCCHQLAHMGADVIKVEMPGSGDLARQLGADAELNARRMGVSFLAQNPGKRSVTVNLKSPDGRKVFLKLVASADVVVENFRPGVMDRLGLGFEELESVEGFKAGREFIFGDIIISTIPLPGHSPGHTGYVIKRNGTSYRPVLFVADIGLGEFGRTFLELMVGNGVFYDIA